MGNLVVVLIILAIVAGAIGKIVVEKRSGAKCIGCPHGKSTDGSCCCKK
jgi:hypothetical protein